MGEWIIYSPLFTLFRPKLLPTIPLQRQDWPSALVHDAVAVAPTLTQDIARLSRTEDAETRKAKREVRQRLICMLGGGFVGSISVGGDCTANICLKDCLDARDWSCIVGTKCYSIFSERITRICTPLVTSYSKAGSYFVAVSRRSFPRRCKPHRPRHRNLSRLSLASSQDVFLIRRVFDLVHLASILARCCIGIWLVIRETRKLGKSAEAYSRISTSRH